MKKRGMISSSVALVLAVPVAAWGLMGQQNAEGVPATELDHAFEPWGVTDGVAAVVGGVALVLAAAGAAVLVRGARSGDLDRRWWSVLGPLVVVGLVAGVGERILTAGVVGANIGAGLLIMLGTPVAAALLLWALGRGVWLATRGRGNGGDRPGRWGGIAPRGV